MKAAVVEKPGQLVVRDIPMPRTGEYDALCQMLFGAVCSATDNHLLEGRMPWPVSYPTVLGHESIGRVIEVGHRVRRFKVGDLVTRVSVPPGEGLNVNWGGFAEYGVAKDHWTMREEGLAPGLWSGHRVNQVLPPHVDPRSATLVINWRETLSYATRMGLVPGASVLVIGSGGVGLAFAAHARNLGAGHLTMIGNQSRMGLGHAAGAEAYLNYRSDDLSSLLKHEAPFDIVIDAVGKRGQVDLALPFLKPGGTVGIYGIEDHGLCSVNPHLARGTFTVYNAGYDEEEAHEDVISFWQRGLLDSQLWLDVEQAFSLDDIAGALRTVRERRMVKSLVQLGDVGQ